MKSRMIAIAIAVSGLLPIATTQAQTRVPDLERAQHQIREQIAQGVRGGALTRGEADQLYQQERSFDKQLALMTRDGRFTHDERRRAQSDLQRLQANLDRKLNNRRHSANALSGVAHRQAMVRQRIADGVAAGRITRAEARRLEQREQDMQRAHARAQRDGVITAQERALLRDQIALLESDVERMLKNHHRVSYSR